MKFSSLTDRIAGEGAEAWVTHFQAVERKARGEDIIILSVGDPNFDTPAAIVDAAVAALRGGDTHYAPVEGREPLRQAIVDQYRAQSGFAAQADNVVVVAGAQCALYATAQCLFEAGDEVVVPEPMYVTYQAAIGSSGARLKPVALRADKDFALQVEDIAAAITPRTRGIAINSPQNPTGRMLGEAQWRGIAELCRKHDLWLISDEVYSRFCYSAKDFFPVTLPDMAERTVVLNSLSKSHAMTGWRLGWAICPPQLAKHMGNLALCMLYGSPGFVQEAARVALTRCDADVETMRREYLARRDLVCDALGSVPGLKIIRPDAGMFIMLGIEGTGLTTADFLRRLLNERGVSVLDGAAFGPSAAGYVRISLAVSAAELQDACHRIRDFVLSLTEKR
ncbi:MAG TPA: aminotransferase class I/II-fold pyridoxal phosphate-dependent enzyme [Nevskiaceae bacterium]|nr:aminotransferase class I/II-fold pyridoxal phosphate-dependent enzyme [Nevskiaceae bacterium]